MRSWKIPKRIAEQTTEQTNECRSFKLRDFFSNEDVIIKVNSLKFPMVEIISKGETMIFDVEELSHWLREV